MTTPAPISPIDSLYKITVGIRHERHFGIMDSSGRVVDVITKDKDTPFPKAFFTKIGMGAGRERRIESADRSSRIDITTDDLIFQYGFKGAGKTFEAAFKWMVEECLPFFKDKVLKPNHVTDYQRLGIIFGHKLTAPKSINEMVSSLTTSTISNPETMILRVSKKLAVPEALAMKEINDYRNVIFSLNKTEDGNLDVDVDIQHYFDPFVDSLDNYKGYPAFFNQAKELLCYTYHPMIERQFFAKGIEAAK